mgnify:CR=1 FL=1
MSFKKPAPFHDSSGTAAAEALFSAILLTILLFAGFELGRAVSIKHSLDVGVYRATRYLALNQDIDQAKEMIWHEIEMNVLGHGYTDSQIRNAITFPLGNPGYKSFGEMFAVRCTLPYQATVPFMNLGQRQMTVEHRQSVERFP